MSELQDNNQQMYGRCETQAGQPPDNEFIPPDAQPLCPRCLQPCDPRMNYCPNCDSNEVINPFASYMPFESIRFKYGFFGKAWRKTWYDTDTPLWLRLICLVTTVICAPVLLVAGFLVLLTSKSTSPRLRMVTIAALCLIAVLLLFLRLLA